MNVENTWNEDAEAAAVAREMAPMERRQRAAKAGRLFWGPPKLDDDGNLTRERVRVSHAVLALAEYGLAPRWDGSIVGRHIRVGFAAKRGRA